jgi:cytochrome b involved in lipid metabolism
MNRLLVSSSQTQLSFVRPAQNVRIVCSRYAHEQSTRDGPSLQTDHRRQYNRSNWRWIGGSVASIGLCALWLYRNRDDLERSTRHWNSLKSALRNSHSVQAFEAKDVQELLLTRFGLHKPNLPSYKISEVAKHRSKDTRIWVAFQSGVYDITDFVDKHPGGEAILMAAGGSLEPFWAIYANHKTEQVLDILESYRIGNLDEQDQLSNSQSDSSDPFAHDPNRHPALKVHTQKPFNAEAPTALLHKQFLTSNELFFVRNHLPVPEVDVHDYELEISGYGLKEPITLTYDDLARLPQSTVVTTIQCAGT